MNQETKLIEEWFSEMFYDTWTDQGIDPTPDDMRKLVEDTIHNNENSTQYLLLNSILNVFLDRVDWSYLSKLWSVNDYEYDDSMDGDHDSAMASAGWGTDEDYNYHGE